MRRPAATIIAIEGLADLGTSHGKRSHRNLRLAVRARRGTFYPEDLPQKNELAYASRQVNSIEINGTFYSPQTAEELQRVVRRDAGGLRFLTEGKPVHHAHPPAARRGVAAGELLCHGDARVEGETWANPVAISTELCFR